MNKQTSTPAKGSDNNKRLAALEAGVSALAIALTANGITLEDGADPLETAVGAIKDLASLRAQVAQLADHLIANHPAAIGDGGAIATAIGLLESGTARNVELEAKVATLEEAAGNSSAADTEAAEGDVEADRLRARVVELEEEVKELGADVEDLASEKNRLANELTAALEGRPAAGNADVDDEPEEAPAAIERIRPETARDVGPSAGGHSPAELDELLTTGDVHGLEVVFSNGEYEILTLQPIAIGPKDLQPIEGRHAVVPPIFAKLLATDAQEEIAGAGLLLQGEQIAYCAFPERLTLHPGGERRFERAIYF